MAATFSQLSVRELLLYAAPALAVVVLGFWLAFQFVKPGPPQTVAITTGSEGGAYTMFARRYRSVLARAKITLDVRNSAGSLENLARLKDVKTGISAGLMQGGLANVSGAPDLVSVGRLFQEPLWVFYRGAELIDRLTQLKGKRLAVGPEDSGTRQLALTLLAPNDVTSVTAILLPFPSNAAAAALLAGEADAVFLVSAPEAPVVQSLLRAPGIRLMSFAQADAYTRLFPYLTRLTLPQGVIDLVRNIPPLDVQLVAPAAELLVRADLHPAIVTLLAQAAAETHQGAGLFQKAGEFPLSTDPDFSVSEHALRFYKNGPPFLQRFLPFWLAVLAERMVVLLVPLLTILLPLIKLVPLVYKWRVRQRLLVWYEKLKGLERSIATNASADDLGQHWDEIEKIEAGVSEIPVPLGFSEQFYNLRSHIELVRQRLLARYTAQVRGATVDT